MKVIGLTGTIGSGKSTVSKILYKEGAYIIDADKIAHKILEPQQKAYSEIINYFGDRIIEKNKRINRKLLADIVFNDKQKLQILNEITHKYIIENMITELKKISISNLYKCAVFDAPLLVDTVLCNYVDKIWLVTADENIRIERIIKRDTVTKEQALNRIKNQKTVEELKGYSDIVIDNSNIDIKSLENIVKKFLYEFLHE